MAKVEMYNTSAWLDMERFFTKSRTRTPVTSHVACHRQEESEVEFEAEILCHSCFGVQRLGPR
jgi:hypothetical protein